MVTVKSISDLPKWFKLDNYDCLANLTIEEVELQLSFRQHMFEAFEEEFENVDMWGVYRDSGKKLFCDFEHYTQYEALKKGDAVLLKCSDDELEEADESYEKDYFDYYEYRLPLSSSIRGFNSLDAYFHGLSLVEGGLIIPEEKLEADYIKQELFTADYDMSNKKLLTNASDGTVSVVIDLKEHTNKEIIADFEKLLPEWRKSLELPEPTDIKYAKVSDFEKIVPYRIIPLLDLLIWGKRHNKRIPHRVIAVKLFPLGEKGETELKQTILVHMNKLLSDKFKKIIK
jgi:hypothetical protein